MPLGRIVPLERTPAEQVVWDRVSKLLYPDNLATLQHLPKGEFYVWLAAVDPYAALVLSSNDQCFYDMVFYQRHKHWYHEVKDTIWRLIYGRKNSH